MPSTEFIFVSKRAFRWHRVLVSGDIYLADDLGREPVMSEYQLQIEALDGGLPRRVQQALISIQVPYKLPPRILPNSTYIQVRENLPPLTTVGRLVAHDSEGPQDTLVFFTKDLDGENMMTSNPIQVWSSCCFFHSERSEERKSSKRVRFQSD